MLKFTFLKYLESKNKRSVFNFQIVAQNMVLKYKFYDYQRVKLLQDYTYYTKKHIMAELMRPKGDPFDIKKNSKI